MSSAEPITTTTRYEDNNVEASKAGLSILIASIIGLCLASIISHGNGTLLALNCVAIALALAALIATFFDSKTHSRPNFSILTVLLMIFIVLVILTAIWKYEYLLTLACINLAFSFFGMVSTR
jgi:hypothetical protein